MRFMICVAVLSSLTACFPAAPPRSQRTESAVKIQAIPEAAITLPAPSVPADPARVTVCEICGITFEGVAFDSRNHRLFVADQPAGPGSRYPDAATAAQSLGGIAAVNAGFFTPEGAPLGLVASSGKISGSWNSASSLGNAVWFESTSGTSAIVRREKLGHPSASTMRELIQAGPLLVEKGHSVGGLEPTKTSVRTVMLWDGSSRWWIGRSAPCTLAALGQALAAGGPAGWPIQQALNLDGGRSSDLWISDAVSGGPVLRRTPWNRPVRNFLVLGLP
jgi:Phosphodiester glycosidase